MVTDARRAKLHHQHVVSWVRQAHVDSAAGVNAGRAERQQQQLLSVLTDVGLDVDVDMFGTPQVTTS